MTTGHTRSDTDELVDPYSAAMQFGDSVGRDVRGVSAMTTFDGARLVKVTSTNGKQAVYRLLVPLEAPTKGTT
jgi:hypothetical protein